MIRQERVLDEAFRTRKALEEADDDEYDALQRENNGSSGNNTVVFDQDTLRLIQREFNAYEKAHSGETGDESGTISCLYLGRLLSALDLRIDEERILAFLDEIGASYDTRISFAECVDILSLLAESQIDEADAEAQAAAEAEYDDQEYTEDD